MQLGAAVWSIGKAGGFLVPVVNGMPFHQDGDERDYVKILETTICDHTDRLRLHPGIL